MPTNLYGKGDNYHPTNSHVMASLIRKFCNAVNSNTHHVECWGSGKPLREFMYADDLGDAVVFSLENWNPSAKNAPKDQNGTPLTHLNVGTGKDITINELANLIAKLSGFKGEIIWDGSKADGTYKKNLDTTNINTLGWQPKIKLNEGIRNTIKFYREEYL